MPKPSDPLKLNGVQLNLPGIDAYESLTPEQRRDPATPSYWARVLTEMVQEQRPGWGWWFDVVRDCTKRLYLCGFCLEGIYVYEDGDYDPHKAARSTREHLASHLSDIRAWVASHD